jgi:hypothetical protein
MFDIAHCLRYADVLKLALSVSADFPYTDSYFTTYYFLMSVTTVEIEPDGFDQ